MRLFNGKGDDLRTGSGNGHFLCGLEVGGSHTYASPLGFKPSVQTIKQDESTEFNVKFCGKLTYTKKGSCIFGLSQK